MPSQPCSPRKPLLSPAATTPRHRLLPVATIAGNSRNIHDFIARFDGSQAGEEDDEFFGYGSQVGTYSQPLVVFMDQPTLGFMAASASGLVAAPASRMEGLDLNSPRRRPFPASASTSGWCSLKRPLPVNIVAHIW